MGKGPNGLPPPQGDRPLPGIQPRMFVAVTTLLA